ncbi:MarR family transcriptional regulator [Candidatus Woesearchaeota archaeon]|nr:MarR family transcriptional regulator [Candidatus Woesearchaeota archaeon]
MSRVKRMEISRNKILISSGLVGLLTIMITVFSIYHTQHLGKAYLQYPLFLYGTTIISLAIGGFIVYLFEEKINKLQLSKLLAILPNDERKVLKILFDRKEIEQKKLTTLAELSTVKISRVISTLEQRGIIEKKKHGYTNLIVLKL